MNEKYENLKKIIGAYGTLAVAFSGGVDSSLLLKVAHDVLGDKAIAITVNSVSFPETERKDGEEFCKELGVEQINLFVDQLAIEGFANNPKDRCYICKREIFTEIKKAAAERGIEIVADGSNVDDDGDFRPGMRAIAELGIRSPLKEAGLTKEEIRNLSKDLNLNTWGKPALACLATRFVYGETITKEKLKMVEKGEDYLRAKGFSQFRVRIHGEDLARIEVLPGELTKLFELREEIVALFAEIGFKHITMDLKGYRMGSMNE